jgi:hypothetical protein
VLLLKSCHQVIGIQPLILIDWHTCPTV